MTVDVPTQLRSTAEVDFRMLPAHADSSAHGVAGSRLAARLLAKREAHGTPSKACRKVNGDQ